MQFSQIEKKTKTREIGDCFWQWQKWQPYLYPRLNACCLLVQATHLQVASNKSFDVAKAPECLFLHKGRSYFFKGSFMFMS